MPSYKNGSLKTIEDDCLICAANSSKKWDITVIKNFKESALTIFFVNVQLYSHKKLFYPQEIQIFVFVQLQL